MLSEILTDVLRFVSATDLASMLLSSPRYSVVIEDVIARRTLRTVIIRNDATVTTGARSPSGSMKLTSERFTASDDVEEKLRLVLHGSIVQSFNLQCNAVAQNAKVCGWFAEALGSVLQSVVVSHSLRLHMRPGDDLDLVYAIVGRFRYVHVSSRIYVVFTRNRRHFQAVEVHFYNAEHFEFEWVDRDVHRAKCDNLGIERLRLFENGAEFLVRSPSHIPFKTRRNFRSASSFIANPQSECRG